MFRSYRHCLLATLCLGSGFAALPLGAQETGYEMQAYIDAPGGRAALDGRYAEAIETASRSVVRRDRATELGAATNLCVAYTLQRNFEDAASACNEAVGIAERTGRGMGSLIRFTAAEAQALMNRGVLRAVTGDALGAADDFRKAARLDDTPASRRNLTELEATAAFRLARAAN